MRLLIVSYCFPPDMNPRAFRWGGLARYWVEEGHEIDVVCGPGRSANTPAGLRVHSVGFSLSAAVRGSQQPTKSSSGDLANPGRPPQPRLAFRVLKRLRDLTWKQVYWPDYAGLWYFAAKRRVARLLAERSYDVAVTVSNPYTGHLLGPVVRRLRPQTRWVADIGDAFSIAPESPVNNRLLYAGRNRRLERRVFAEADCVTVTNEPMAADYGAAFPEFTGKLRVVPPLFSVDDTSASAASPFPADGRKRLVFTGRLYRELRSPAALLTTFQRLIERPEHGALDLHFFGTYDECRHDFDAVQSLIGKRIFLHGEVPRSTALAAVRAADLLVNLGNTTRHQLPSKLVDYASTGKPIVNCSSRNDDSSARFLANYPAVLNVFGDPASDADEWERLSRFIAEPPPVVEPAVVEQILEPYRLPTIAGKYEAAFRAAGEPRFPG